MTEECSPETTPAASTGNTSAKSADSDFTAVEDILTKRGYVPPKCAICRDTGVRGDVEIRYTRAGIMVPVGVCECEAGKAKLAEIAEQQAENERRWQRKRRNLIEHYRENCGVPPRMMDWHLDSYPGDAQLAALAKRYVEDVDITNPEKSQNGLLLIGQSGSGKTGLAVGILFGVIERLCCESFFVETSRFLRDIRATFRPNAERSTEEVTDKIRKVDFLVLDDIGDVGRGDNQASDFARGEMFDLVNHRHGEMLPTVLTSNLTVDQLAKQFGDRTWWRIREMCMVVAVTGKNLRA